MTGTGFVRLANTLAVTAMLAGCGTLQSAQDAVFGGGGPQPGQPGYVEGFLGAAVADEPRAALIGREVLSTGGTAADAAVAIGFALGVTLPSRAGLGGGGACLAYAPDVSGINQGVPEAILFVPGPAADRGAGAGDRPAAIPMMARGLFLLHARYGRQSFEALVARAERLARFGTPASRALTRDLAVVATPLAADPAARATFFAGGQPLAEGATLMQPDLGATLSQIRTTGVGDLYQGALAARLVEAAPSAGAQISPALLRAALPTRAAAIAVPAGDDIASFLPPPADGGLAAAAAFASLRGTRGDLPAADARAASVLEAARSRGGEAQALLAASLPPAAPRALPASTTFATLDRTGAAVVCAVTMNNLFGTGRIVPGTGLLLAASPAMRPPAALSAAIAYNAPLHAFRAAVGGSGQSEAPLATAASLAASLDRHAPAVAGPDPGRANVILCASYLPGNARGCSAATDKRGNGLVAGSDNAAQ